MHGFVACSFVLCVNVYILGSPCCCIAPFGGWRFHIFSLPWLSTTHVQFVPTFVSFTLISFCCMLNLEIKCRRISMLLMEMECYLNILEKKESNPL